MGKKRLRLLETHKGACDICGGDMVRMIAEQYLCVKCGAMASLDDGELYFMPGDEYDYDEVFGNGCDEDPDWMG